MNILHILGLVLAAAIVSALVPTALHAQGSGLFDSLFGQRFRIPPSPVPEQPGPATQPVQPRLRITVVPRRPAPQAAYGYCVRLCDGRYFPLPRLVSPRASAQTLCQALCPAAPTSLFVGADIATAVNAQNIRYAKLATAYRFREAVAADCTCNGVDSFGTAAISIYHDITLHPGDIVATAEGMRVFAGTRGETHPPDTFVALDDYPRLSPQLRGELGQLRIDAPAPISPSGSEPLPEPLTVRARIIIGFEAMTATGMTPRIIPLSR